MSRVRRVVVVGRDAAAWVAALALHRAVGRTGVTVAVVALPSLLGPAEVFSATPSLGGLHRLLGVREADVLRACRGVPVLGQRFAGWSGDGSAFLHGYDSRRPGINDIDFVQFWIKARGEGLRVPLEQFSIAAMAARQGRIGRESGPEEFGSLAPGYHLGALSYARAMREAAIAAGVTEHAGTVATVERAGERIAAVVLTDGARIAGDLFVDASGAEAVLAPADAERETWSDWLPCDRVMTASAPPLSPLPAFADLRAFEAGWVGLFPLQNRTGIVAAYGSRHLSDADLAARLPALVGAPLQGEVMAAPIAPGALRRPWTGNCVAIGEAAVCLEPIDAVQLHLVHLGLSHLIALFPVEAEAIPEAAAYNAIFARSIANVRDFQIAHYRLNRREGEPFWDAARGACGPETLERKLRQFASRGQVPQYDDESFQEQNWVASFIGHGLMPRGYDPMVDTVPKEEAIEKFQGLLHLIATEVKAMPTVEAYLAPEPTPQRTGLF